MARSYVSMLVDPDPVYSTPDDLSPRDRQGHGTAIAMIAAGVQMQPLAAVAMTPKAFLGNYRDIRLSRLERVAFPLRRG